MNEASQSQYQMVKSPFYEYSEIKQHIALAEARLKELQPVIAQKLFDEGVKKKVTEFGEFSIRTTTKETFEYTPAVAELEGFIEAMVKPHKAKLEGLKKEQQESGEAKKSVSVNETLVFNQLKKEAK